MKATHKGRLKSFEKVLDKGGKGRDFMQYAIDNENTVRDLIHFKDDKYFDGDFA